MMCVLKKWREVYCYCQPKKIWFGGGDFITGCVTLIRKEVFEDIGYLYEPYFLTIEDLDFSWFAQKAGWKIKVNLDSCIWHKVSSSRAGEFSFSNGYYDTRNRLFFAFKRTHNFIGGCVLLFLVLPIRIIQWFLTGHFKMAEGTILGCFDFFRNRLGVRK